MYKEVCVLLCMFMYMLSGNLYDVIIESASFD